MIYWDKSEGGFILITFTEDLTGTVSGNESHFSISWQEYEYAPDGPLVAKTGAVTATYPGETARQAILEMVGTQRFNNAAGQIRVVYDGQGTLAGVGGSVEAFSVYFTPVDLLAKPNQNDVEHVKIANITATASLPSVSYYSFQHKPEHVEIASIATTGVLTHIEDL